MSTRRSLLRKNTSTSVRLGLGQGFLTGGSGSAAASARLEEMVNMVPFRSNLARRTLKEAGDRKSMH